MAGVSEARKAGSQPRSTVGDEAGTGAVVEAEFAKFERLDQLVRGLVERFAALQDEHAQALLQLGQRDEQIRELNQRRQDAGKRLDDVLARLDQLDAQLERRQALPSDEES